MKRRLKLCLYCHVFISNVDTNFTFIVCMYVVELPAEDLHEGGPVVDDIDELKDKNFSIEATTDAPPTVNGKAAIDARPDD